MRGEALTLFSASMCQNGTFSQVNLIMVCNLTKMAQFVPCHNEITAEESTYLFMSNCYIVNGGPKVIIFYRDSKFVGKLWQRFMGKLNTKLNMSTARHPRTGDLTER